MESNNPYCAALGIPVPRLETAATASDANYYSLLIAALLENGAPMTLEAVAKRFEEAGIADAWRALRSLKRCKPGRAPVYRDGDLYALDPHDHEASLWAFRLGLRPPAPRLRIVRPEPPAPPSTDEPLSVGNLEEAWRGSLPYAISTQRVVVCVLDAHRRPMSLEEITAFVTSLAPWRPLSEKDAYLWRRDAPMARGEDGKLALVPGHEAIRPARAAVAERIATRRRSPYRVQDPAETRAYTKRAERKRAARAEALAKLSRVVVYAFPESAPEAVVLVDVARRTLDTYVGEELPAAVSRLAAYDAIEAVDVRGVLRGLGFDPGTRRLGELGPPQKTKMLQNGRTLRITLDLLVQGSCRIRRPFADRKILRRYLRDGRHDKLRAGLASDAKSLFALYMYGRLHGAVRLWWRSVDMMLPVPWVHRDETTFYGIVKQAFEEGAALEVVVGEAPTFEDPWARAERVTVMETGDQWKRYFMVGASRFVIDEWEVQMVRREG